MANGYPDPYAPPQQPGMFGGNLGGLQGMFGGLSRGFRRGGQALHPYSNRLLLTGMGLLSGGRGMGDAMKGLIAGSALDTEDADRRKLNAAIAALQNDTEGGLFSGLSEAERNYVANDPAAVRTLIAGKLGGAGGTKYGMSPVWGTDAEGNPVLLQLSSGGGVSQVDMPEGVTPSPSGTQRVDLGTEWGILDRNGQIIQRIPKDVAGEAAQQKVGETQGAAAASIPKVRQAAELMKGMITSIRTDPNMDWGVGGTSVFNRIPGSPGLAFQKKSDQLRGQAFTQAFETLKGGGAISEREGAAATDAMTRLDTALSKADYLKALDDLEAIVKKAEQWTREKAGQETNGGGAPAVGTVEDGHRFVGGDPADPNNWEPVQ